MTVAIVAAVVVDAVVVGCGHTVAIVAVVAAAAASLHGCGKRKESKSPLTMSGCHIAAAVVVDCGPDVVIVVDITAAVAPLPGCCKRKTSTSSLTAQVAQAQIH